MTVTYIHIILRLLLQITFSVVFYSCSLIDCINVIDAGQLKSIDRS